MKTEQVYIFIIQLGLKHKLIVNYLMEPKKGKIRIPKRKMYLVSLKPQCAQFYS